MWKEEAGKTMEGDMDMIYTQTIMQAFKPEVSLLIKQLVPKWPGLDTKGFKKEFKFKKDSAACFDIPKT